MKYLHDDECVEADCGYRGCEKIKCPNDWITKSSQKAKLNVRARHEAINGQIKSFRALSQRFRNDIQTHKNYFCVAVIMTQFKYNRYGAQFHVEY